MKQTLYITELRAWLNTNKSWSIWQKLSLVMWLASWPYTLIAATSLFFLDSELTAGIYLLNYPALLLLKPRVVRHHHIKWKRNYDNQ